MSRYQWIETESIKLNWELNPRQPDDAHAKTIARHINANGYDTDFPVIVYGLPAKGTYFLATGYHRLTASQIKDDEFPNLPLKKIYCEVRKGTMDEVIHTMMTDNFQWSPEINPKLGKMPSRDEIHHMRYRLMLFPDTFRKGDRLLASEWSCSQTLIRAMREEVLRDLETDEKVSIPYFTDDARDEIHCIVARDMYLGIDGKERPRSANAIPITSRESERLQTLSALREMIGHLNDSITEFTADFTHLSATYCQRRLFGVLGLTEPGEVCDWKLGTVKSQLEIASALEEILDEMDIFNLQTLENPIHALLDELMKINTVMNTYAMLGEYAPPFLHQPLSAALDTVQRVWTADWESKPRTERMTDLDVLLRSFATHKEYEDKARATSSAAEKAKVQMHVDAEAAFHGNTDIPSEVNDATQQLHIARELLNVASERLYTAWHSETGFAGEYDDFLAAAADAFSCDFYELRNVVDFENVNGARKFRFELSLKSLQDWKAQAELITAAITAAMDDKPEWLLPLLAISKIDECRQYLTDHFENNGTRDALDFGWLAIKYNCMAEDVEKIATELWATAEAERQDAAAAIAPESQHAEDVEEDVEVETDGIATAPEKKLCSVALYYESVNGDGELIRSGFHYGDTRLSDKPFAALPVSVREQLQDLLNDANDA